MEGRFHIRVEVDGRGGHRIADRDITAPFHLSRPYADPHALIVQLVHVTPGALAGDRFSISASVGKGASALLTSPSALRIHPTPDSRAECLQRYEVAEQGWLEVWPEWLIPQKSSTFIQKTDIHVASGGAAYIVETLTPGRVAHGERFAFDHLHWSTRCHIEHRLVLSEIADVSAQQLMERLAYRDWSTPYFAGILIIGLFDLPMRNLQQTLHTEHQSRIIGLTQLEPELCSVKIIAADSLAMRKTLHEVRDTFRPHLPRLAANPRKL